MLQTATTHTPILSYQGGHYTAMSPDQVPPWITDALTDDPETMDFRLAVGGCQCIEAYGDDMGLDIWQHPDGFLVLYYTDGQLTCAIYAESIADYLDLDSRFIAPTATKIMLEHDHFQKMKVLRQQVREAA